MNERTLELVSHHLCPYVQRAAIVLAEKAIPHTRTYIDLADKPAWFTALSPLGRVPVLRVGDVALFESAVICEYLDETTPGRLLPADPLERARHRAWVALASSLLDDVAAFYRAGDEAAFAAARSRLASGLDRVERDLAGPGAAAGPYFAGQRFSLVDAAFAPLFRYFDVFEEIDDFGFFAATPSVSAWRAALARRPSVRDAVAPDYAARLRRFIDARGSRLARLLHAA